MCLMAGGTIAGAARRPGAISVTLRSAIRPPTSRGRAFTAAASRGGRSALPECGRGIVAPRCPAARSRRGSSRCSSSLRTLVAPARLRALLAGQPPLGVAGERLGAAFAHLRAQLARDAIDPARPRGHGLPHRRPARGRGPPARRGRRAPCARGARAPPAPRVRHLLRGGGARDAPALPVGRAALRHGGRRDPLRRRRRARRHGRGVGALRPRVAAPCRRCQWVLPRRDARCVPGAE